jgi:hypothetical protein
MIAAKDCLGHLWRSTARSRNPRDVVLVESSPFGKFARRADLSLSDPLVPNLPLSDCPDQIGIGWTDSGAGARISRTSLPASRSGAVPAK